MNSSSKDFLKFYYLVISIQVSSVIGLRIPLKATACKIFIISSWSVILLIQGLCQVRKTAEELIHILHYILSVPANIKSDLVSIYTGMAKKGAQSCKHLNTHLKSILGVLLLRTWTITTHNYNALHFGPKYFLNSS